MYIDDLENEIYYRETAVRLREPFEVLMAYLAPSRPAESTQSLHGYLCPPWFILEATIADGGHIQPRFKEALSRQDFVRLDEYMRWLRPYLCPLLALEFIMYSHLASLS